MGWHSESVCRCGGRAEREGVMVWHIECVCMFVWLE